MAELTRRMVAAQALGIGACNLMGTLFGGEAALWLGLQKPERGVGAGWNHRRRSARRARHPAGTPEEIARRLFAHRERQPPLTTLDPRQAAKQGGLRVTGVRPATRPRP